MSKSKRKNYQIGRRRIRRSYNRNFDLTKDSMRPYRRKYGGGKI